MRKFFITLIVTLIMIAPLSAQAYKNKIEISLSGGGGEAKRAGLNADIKMGAWEIGYTRFLSEIATDDSPYGAREFLQHPSQLSISVSALGVTVTPDNIDAEMETGQGSMILGGSYTIDNGNKDTVLSLALYSATSVDKGKLASVLIWEEETTGSSLRLGMEQYLAQNVSIGIGIEGGNYETEYKIAGGPNEEYSEGMLTVWGSTLYNNYLWLAINYWGGISEEKDSAWETKRTGSSLSGGVYANPKVFLFMILSSETAKKKEFGTSTEDELSGMNIGIDYYISQSSHFIATLESATLEMDNGDEISSAALSLGFGQYF